MQTEKVSFNINLVDLGKIDYLVSNCIYTNRTEFIKTAIINELRKNENWLENSFLAKRVEIGIISLTNEKLLKYKNRNDLYVIGILKIPDNIDKDLLYKIFNKIVVFGKFEASSDIIEFYLNKGAL